MLKLYTLMFSTGSVVFASQKANILINLISKPLNETKYIQFADLNFTNSKKNNACFLNKYHPE